MSMILNPNGGMTYTRFFPSDWRTGCMILTLEEEGLYIRICAYMYDTGRALPDKDPEAARLLRVQIHKYRKLVASLVAKGKLIRAQGLLINERVIEEFDKWRIATVARSEAAKKREADRKAQMQRELAEALKRGGHAEATPGLTPHLTPHPTPGLTPPVNPGVTHPVPPELTPGLNGKKPNEINGRDTTAVAQPWHEDSTKPKPVSQNQNPEEERKLASQTPRAGGEVLAGGPFNFLNGSAEPMIADIVGWMIGGDRQHARNWLQTFLGLYPPDVVRESYFKLKTDIADGKPIARPLQTWGSIAARLRARPSASEAAPKESTRESIRRLAEQAEERAKGKRRI